MIGLAYTFLVEDRRETALAKGLANAGDGRGIFLGCPYADTLSGLRRP